MTEMTYDKAIIKKVKPTVVNLDFFIKSTGTDPGETLNRLNDIRKLCKDFIVAKKSYRLDSYKQENTSFRKVMKTRIFYRYKLNPFKTISAERYEIVDPTERSYYEKDSIEEFDRYEATLYIKATLNNSETVIDDFTDIINMCVDKEITCTYNHTITDEERQHYNLRMYAECVNAAIEEIKEIIDNIDIQSDKFEITEISDNSGHISRDVCFERSVNYKPEQYFIPELIKELFNNDIELTKSLRLTIVF